MKDMKREGLAILAAAAFIAAGCSWLDPPGSGIARCDKFPRGSYSDGRGGRSSDSTEAGQQFVPDTIVWASAVQVPDDYYWPRDTAMGVMDAKLLLFKDDEQVLSLPVGAAHGISPNPETHHLIGGHLYTEFNSSSGTQIRRDGEPVCQYEGREVLKGLLPVMDDIFTLGLDKDDNSLVYRKNGTIMLKMDGARALGGPGENSPALYMDGGHQYFAMHQSGSTYLVTDGSMKKADAMSNSVMDYRIIGGVPYCIFVMGNNIFLLQDKKKSVLAEKQGSLEDFHVIGTGDGVFAAGTSRGKTMVRNVRDSCTLELEGESLFLYESRGKMFSVSAHRPVTVREVDTGLSGNGKLLMEESGCYFFSRGCGFAIEGSLWLAVSTGNGPPFIWKDGEELREFSLNGYLTGVEVQLTSPN